MRRLTDEDLNRITGIVLSGYTIERVRVKRGTFTDSDHYGIMLGKNAIGSYVTWEFHLDENDEPNNYWGHYFEGMEPAVRDYDTRDMSERTFAVTITETLKLTVEVEAIDQLEAEQVASDAWRNGEYVLGADEFVDVAFTACEG